MPSTRLVSCRRTFASFCRATLLGVLALGATFAADAADFAVGLSAGVNHGRDDCLQGYSCDRSSGYWKLTGTYRVMDAVDLQASYFHSGDFKGADTTPLGTPFSGSFRVDGVGVTAGYRWTVAPGWGASVRAGAASVHTRFSYDAPFSGSPGKTTVEPIAGAMVDYAVTPAVRIGLDYDFTRFKAYQTHGPLHLFGAAVQYAF